MQILLKNKMCDSTGTWTWETSESGWVILPYIWCVWIFLANQDDKEYYSLTNLAMVFKLRNIGKSIEIHLQNI